MRPLLATRAVGSRGPACVQMGLQHRRTGAGDGEEYWWPDKASRLYFLQNALGTEHWPVTDDIVAELEATFNPKAPDAALSVAPAVATEAAATSVTDTSGRGAGNDAELADSAEFASQAECASQAPLPAAADYAAFFMGPTECGDFQVEPAQYAEFTGYYGEGGGYYGGGDGGYEGSGDDYDEGTHGDSYEDDGDDETRYYDGTIYGRLYDGSGQYADVNGGGQTFERGYEEGGDGRAEPSHEAGEREGVGGGYNDLEAAADADAESDASLDLEELMNIAAIEL